MTTASGGTSAHKMSKLKEPGSARWQLRVALALDEAVELQHDADVGPREQSVSPVAQFCLGRATRPPRAGAHFCTLIAS
jgi:hypothetical protein